MFGSVGAYHTHGFATACGSACAGIRNAVCPDTSNTSPSSGSAFLGGSPYAAPGGHGPGSVAPRVWCASPPARIRQFRSLTFTLR